MIGVDGIAYASIFAASVDEAAVNLIRLMIGGECGFEGGALTWRGAIAELLLKSSDLSELNRFGARFTGEEWRWILETVVARLENASH